MRVTIWLVCAVLLLGGLSAAAQSDPFAENFYTPEFIKQVHELIGVTEEQKATVGAQIHEIQESIQVIRGALARESATLAELAKADKVNEDKLLAQADKVMALESDVKRAQLQMLIKIKNALTPEQQAKLKEYKAKMSQLQPKMRTLQEMARRAEAAGIDLSPLREKKTEFDALIQQGKFEDAEALLSATMKQVEEKLPK